MSADPSDAPWTPEEASFIEATYPELIVEPIAGQKMITITRREAEYLAARFPSMLRPAPVAPVAGESAEKAALRARYPNSAGMFHT